ncbi:hypothetical protein IscW_ISCW017370 [Ixodes scapularis]|uniref:Uncharacterized protein n=1 Tax=Ixodes scapularis TaxID=6945 RepID=B7PD45_IXOSC|nr:hypothetical protein IscW_ISCW017370 [Ixodes scapularis]|eukprot:XP_002410607.1 hypothetical protein IscW_ISCW017370 [Ixodes scapularis]
MTCGSTGGTRENRPLETRAVCSHKDSPNCTSTPGSIPFEEGTPPLAQRREDVLGNAMDGVVSYSESGWWTEQNAVGVDRGNR